MELIKQAVEDFKTAILAEEAWRPDCTTTKNQDLYNRWYLSNGKHEANEEFVRLRLDWEFYEPELRTATDNDSFESILKANREKIVNFFTVAMNADLSDLVENGDVSLTADPLLKAMNGSKKRGTEPEHT